MGEGGKVRQPGGYCHAVRPEESVGAPVRRAPGSFSTPHLLGTYCCAGPPFGPGRRPVLGDRSTVWPNRPMFPHAPPRAAAPGRRRPRAPCARAGGPRRRTDRGRARGPGRRRCRERVRRRLHRSRRRGGVPRAGDPGEPQQRDARAADDPTRRHDAATRRARRPPSSTHSRSSTPPAPSRPGSSRSSATVRHTSTATRTNHRSRSATSRASKTSRRAEVRGGCDPHRRKTDHRPQQAGRRARR